MTVTVSDCVVTFVTKEGADPRSGSRSLTHSLTHSQSLTQCRRRRRPAPARQRTSIFELRHFDTAKLRHCKTSNSLRLSALASSSPSSSSSSSSSSLWSRGRRPSSVVRRPRAKKRPAFQLSACARSQATFTHLQQPRPRNHCT